MLVLLCQLPGVIDVVPDAVEASCERCEGVEEGVSYPDGEDGVLLSAGLCGADGIGVASAYEPACCELHDAGQERAGEDEEAGQPRHVGMYEDAGRDGYGERQGHEPEVEGKVGMRGDEAREGG